MVTRTMQNMLEGERNVQEFEPDPELQPPTMLGIHPRSTFGP
jgi:hypothetical protein